MTAFILSSAIAFALYELLASVDWPAARGDIPFRWGNITINWDVVPAAWNLVRAAMVTAVLLTILIVHTFASQFDAIAKYEVNIVFGFVFGPLLAIWVNSVVVHSAKEDLSRGQILAAISLLLLFFFGTVGNETAGLIRRYSNSLSSVKVAGAELSFSNGRNRNDPTVLPFTPTGGTGTTFPSDNNPGLSNLAVLDKIIERDDDYLTTALFPKIGAEDKAKDEANRTNATSDLHKAQTFASASIVQPAACLAAWFQKTGDARAFDGYLAAFAGLFRRLEVLNGEMNSQTEPPASADDRETQEMQRLTEISSDFVRHGLTMALDIASSIPHASLPEKCKSWFEIYCRADVEGDRSSRPCLAAALKDFEPPAKIQKSEFVEERISSLSKGLSGLINQRPADRRGLEALPYFAIARASLMEQLEQHEAAAAILDDWLRGRSKENTQSGENSLLQIKDDWLALRVRSALISYVDNWLDDQDANAATVVRTEHLENLRVTKDGFRRRLLKADFFRKLDDACQTKCDPTFRRPTECVSDEPHKRLELWRKLYSSYITYEYTYIHRALEHPDYQSKFAEAVNDEARRLVNYDMSCAVADPKPDVLYGQSLLAFVENALGYSKVRARTDGADVQKRRLDEAEHAAKFGLEIVEQAASEDQERAEKPYLQRIAPSFAVSVQEQLKTQLKKIDQARAELLE